MWSRVGRSWEGFLLGSHPCWLPDPQGLENCDFWAGRARGSLSLAGQSGEGRGRAGESPVLTAVTSAVKCQSQQATLCARRGCMEAIVAQLGSESEELHQVHRAGERQAWPASLGLGRLPEVSI